MNAQRLTEAAFLIGIAFGSATANIRGGGKIVLLHP
jgi:hypothetical protein